MTQNKKLVRIEPNPFKKAKLKIKMARSKLNSAGEVLVDHTGKLRTEDVEPENMIQVPGTAKTITPPLTASGLKTGLNELVDNPYADEDVYFPQWGEKVLKGKEKALRQHILEYKHGKDFNYYTGNIIDRIEPSNKMSQLPFFMTPHSKVYLSGNVTFLDLNNPIHEVQYYMLKAHNMVANSYSELQNGKNLTALYFMVDDAEVSNVKMDKLRKETQAASALEELKAAGDDILVMMAKALGNEEKNLTASRAFTWIYRFYKNGGNQYVQFMKYFEMYKDAGRREYFVAAAKLQEYIDYRIIRKSENKYYWTKPETDDSPVRVFEWSSKDKVIKDFLLAPEFQDEVEHLDGIHKARK